ncbi:ABC transporter substrate-binding protein [Dichotomicrobium thermohalophilum]|nr:ABC transporter substrate-binding protein [Dichotomicrobium thermohalophilum]
MRRLSVLALLMVLFGGGPSAADEPRTLTVLTWGGAYEQSQRAAMFAPFTQATGIEIETVRYNGGIEALRDHLAQPGAPEWDVVDMIRADARAACAQGLLEPFDPDILADSPDGVAPEEDFIDGALGDCAIVQLVFATVIAYNDDAFPGEKPRTVADFFDTERFPGKRALRKAPVGMLEWALRSYGVPRSQLYDLLSTERGMRLAFRRLDSIRDDIIWWRGGAEPVEQLTSGHAAMATGFNGRFFHAQVIEGEPISIIWDGALLEYNSWAILKGTADKDIAEKFIRFATGAERLGDMANRISYGPARKSAQRRVGLHVTTGVPMRAHMPTTDRHMATAIRKDDRWYSQTEALRQRRFEAWLALGEKQSAKADQAKSEGPRND